MAKQVNKGAIKYKSIKAMAESMSKKTGIKYMTIYMRLRMGMSVSEACHKPVRAYNRKEQELIAVQSALRASVAIKGMGDPQSIRPH